MKLREILCLASIAAAIVVAPRAAIAAEIEGSIEVGQKAPSIELKDQNGMERSLAQMLKKGKVALVFYRSASW